VNPVKPHGPVPARIMIVGEAPGEREVQEGRPFCGASGWELDKMLGEAGISRGECFVTNLARYRPPNNDIDLWIRENSKIGKLTKDDELKASHGIDVRKFLLMRDMLVHPYLVEGYEMLKAEIKEVKPNVIIPVGNTSMWALTGRWGITNWRGSMLYADHFPDRKVIPTIHPAAVLREWSWRASVVSDFRRAKRFINGEDYPDPGWKFHIRPSFDQVIPILEWLFNRLESGEHLRLSFDLETRSSHIACAGISWSLRDGICIPFMCVGDKMGYWTEEQEAEIVYLLCRIFTHRDVEVVGQNLLYDSQYTWRWWHFVPAGVTRKLQDTMIAQHSLFSDLPKKISFQASLYCDYYRWWKDEGKNLDQAGGEDEGWYYNCEDCVYTDECGRVELDIAKQLKLEKVYAQQQALFWPVLKAMLKGVAIDIKMRDELTLEVIEEVSKRQQFLIDILGHPLNPKSPQQMKKLFYEDLNQPVIMKRAKKGQPARPTLEDDALQTIARREPLLKPLVNAISDIRTLGVFLSGFLQKPLSYDGRMRCSYNIGGSASGKSAPVTYRLSSSEDAFDSGGNLQNIPSEKSKSIGKAKARGNIAAIGDPYQLPNLRAMFVPDPGYDWWNGDLDRADLQVVAWEAEDELLKEALRRGVDIHLLNAYTLRGKDAPELSELVESHPKYPDHRGPLKYDREFSKVFCHATNYVGSARAVAAGTGRTIHEVDRAQKIWFGAHPGIKRWHDRTEAQIGKHRFVENKFGYRWYIFDRVDTILPEAVAWIPQSTVSIVINKIWLNIDSKLTRGTVDFGPDDVQTLIQVHDSLGGQFPSRLREQSLAGILECSRVIVPYEDPLVIPFSVTSSPTSWGNC
jgi:uracil-DNA glycosylase/DNA polymerase I-like protein with 3'-5' exonuclease and polymerase domains